MTASAPPALREAGVRNPLLGRTGTVDAVTPHRAAAI